MSKPLTLKSEQNLFMPNFSTKNSDDPDEEINSSNNMSVISQWDKLPSADSEPDESFSEMKPTKVIYQRVLTTKPLKVSWFQSGLLVSSNLPKNQQFFFPGFLP